jgi:hypothetical protein
VDMLKVLKNYTLNDWKQPENKTSIGNGKIIIPISITKIITASIIKIIMPKYINMSNINKINMSNITSKINTPPLMVIATIIIRATPIKINITNNDKMIICPASLIWTLNTLSLVRLKTSSLQNLSSQQEPELELEPRICIRT